MKNLTCNILKQRGMWQTLAMNTFAPVYPTSIRGSEDNQKGVSGTR